MTRTLNGGTLVALAVALILILGTAIGFGIRGFNRPPQAESPITVTTTAPAQTPSSKAPPASTSLGDCNDQRVLGSADNLVVTYCDGQWMHVGVAQTDHLELFTWSGDRWTAYQPDGTSPISGYDCYSESALEAAGAPKALRDEVLLCDDAPVGNISGDFLPWPSCSGEYVLIDPGVTDYQETVLDAMARHPGSTSTYPGACAAFRSEVNGQMIYPIYIDYGGDIQGVCAAEARGEGNARQLMQFADYSSPCM